LTPTARGSVRKPASADPTLHARRHGATVLPARNGPSRPPHWCAWDAFCKNGTLLKDGKGRKLRADWQKNVERDQFGSHRFTWTSRPEPFVLEGAGAQRGGLRGATCAGRGRTSCAGGGRSREPCATTLAVARKSCASRAASTSACDAFGGHGKKRGGGPAVGALSGVPSDSVACDNLGLAVLSIPNAHRVFGSNGNGPVSSSMLRTASALALALFLAGMLNA
jgi:hypothetical protein